MLKDLNDEQLLGLIYETRGVLSEVAQELRKRVGEKEAAEPKPKRGKGKDPDPNKPGRKAK